jgi:hypothetical protein
MIPKTWLAAPIALAAALCAGTALAAIRSAVAPQEATCTTCTQTCTTTGNVTTCISNCRTSSCMAGHIEYPAVSGARNGGVCTVKAPTGAILRGTVAAESCRLPRPFTVHELASPRDHH